MPLERKRSSIICFGDLSYLLPVVVIVFVSFRSFVCLFSTLLTGSAVVTQGGTPARTAAEKATEGTKYQPLLKKLVRRYTDFESKLVSALVWFAKKKRPNETVIPA